MKKLTWKQDGYLHFAHGLEGMWTIEQKRGRFIVTLDLKGTYDATQDMGSYPSMTKAKAGAQKNHRIIAREYTPAPKRYASRARAYKGRS